jgi:hypothetical protein
VGAGPAENGGVNRETTYAHMGRLDDARAIVARLRRVTSVLVTDLSHMPNPDQRELQLSCLRLATTETE